MNALTLSPPEPLRPDHELDGFTSGVEPLDDWLTGRALQNEVDGSLCTFVVCNGLHVVGYYSLAAGSVLTAAATVGVRRNFPERLPVVLLGRLAIDRGWQGRGLGRTLLRDAVRRIVSAGDEIGVRAILVHVISSAGNAFYERFGFRPSVIGPKTLMITLAEARRIMGQAD
jgi:GNAT superfamily N-acetyltransferase